MRHYIFHHRIDLSVIRAFFRRVIIRADLLEKCVDAVEIIVHRRSNCANDTVLVDISLNDRRTVLQDEIPDPSLAFAKLQGELRRFLNNSFRRHKPPIHDLYGHCASVSISSSESKGSAPVTVPSKRHLIPCACVAIYIQC